MDLLEKYGLTEEIRSAARQYLTDDNILARIYSEHRRGYGIITEAGEATAKITGKFMFDQESGLELPAVGDWVIATLVDDTASIHQLLPRHTLLTRKAAGHKADRQIIAANVDTVCIVQSMDGDFNIRRLERYLVMVHDSGAEAVVLLSKSDLIEQAEIDELTNQADAIAHGTRVFAYSALDQSLDGILQEVLTPGHTHCFVGSSGVGKSTMINKLLGAAVQATAAVREDDFRGRHTTSGRAMFLLDNGALLIDTPGMRELGLMADEESLGQAFPEIMAFADDCRYNDCTHTHEIKCAVQVAVKNGDIGEDRYESYVKLAKELAYNANQADQQSRLEYKRKQKALYKGYKQIQSTKKRL